MTEGRYGMESHPSSVECNVTIAIHVYFLLNVLSLFKSLRQRILITMIAACFAKRDHFGTPTDTNAADAFEGFPR